jgi:hypothetical protein
MKTFIQFLLEQSGPGGSGTGLTLPTGQGITAMPHSTVNKPPYATDSAAYYAGTVLGTPAPGEEFAGALSGSVASTGYTEAGAKARFNMYKSITDLGAGLVGKALTPAIGAASGTVGAFGGLLAATAVGGALRGASNETAKIMTSALYDPRAAGALSQLEPLGVTGGIGNYQVGPSISGP